MTTHSSCGAYPALKRKGGNTACCAIISPYWASLLLLGDLVSSCQPAVSHPQPVSIICYLGENLNWRLPANIPSFYDKQHSNTSWLLAPWGANHFPNLYNSHLISTLVPPRCNIICGHFNDMFYIRSYSPVHWYLTALSEPRSSTLTNGARCSDDLAAAHYRMVHALSITCDTVRQ